MKYVGRLGSGLVLMMVMSMMTAACSVQLAGLPADQLSEHGPLAGEPPGHDGPTDDPPAGEFPENPGYLRASHPSSGMLTIFDADTFEVYRKVKLPPSTDDFSHRLEIDPAGRVWIGYSQIGIDHIRPKSERVLVFSPNGDLLHELDLGCAPVDTGIAFANGYAFVACAASGFSGQVFVMDLDTMEVVKTFDKVRPPDEDADKQSFYISVVGAAAESIVIAGFGNPPRDYPRLTNSASAVTRVGVIDPETLTLRGYLTGFEPGMRVLSVLEVGGKAWLFNEMSHLEERPARTDVYVMDPQTLEIVDRFNLENPFPNWAEYGEDESIYIFHKVAIDRLREAGYRAGITRLDLASGVEAFVPTPTLSRPYGMGVYRDRPCLAHRGGKQAGGLWCLSADGDLELKVRQKYSMGVAFRPSGDPD